MKINKLLGLVATSTVVAAPLCTVSCAKEESKTWNVSFDTGCETFIDTVRVEDGGSVDQPEVELKKEGFTFGGWFIDETFEEKSKYTFGTPVTGDLILYAKWTKTPVVTGDKVSIEDKEKEIDTTTRTATFECSFNGPDTIVQFLLPETSPKNLILTETQTSVEDGKFNVTVVYIPSSNDETVEFSLKFAYGDSSTSYIQTIEGLKVTYSEPVEPELVKFEKDSVKCDNEKIAIFKGTWLSDLPKDNKFDDIQIYCLNNEQTLSILDKAEITIDKDGKFEIKIKYLGAGDKGTSSQKFSLKFFFTQTDKQSSTIVDNLTITHEGGEEGAGFIYLYSGSSTLVGQSNVAGSDTKTWRCYYFESKEATSGIDVTSETEFSFTSSTTSHIYFNENSNILSWDDQLSQGMYWGTVKAHWKSAKGFDYYADSSEIAIAIYDFILYNPNIQDYEDSSDTLGHFKTGWKIKIGDDILDRGVGTEDNITIVGTAGITEKFEWNNLRIEAKQTTPAGEYELQLKIQYTYMNYSFEYTTPTLKLHRNK